MEKTETMATIGFLKSRGITARVNKLYQELYGSIETALVKKYHLGITATVPYVKDVVFTTTTTSAVYDAQGVLISPASTTTTATKETGNLIFQDGVLTGIN